ncbi:ATP-binding protein [Sphaerisporangium album]|uniref:ATP-binding protein n=1 Tax=Sphaerisporangium album TaxID=509200 RepID=A0A367ETP5_9ACTN|nr:ATP-binding protein [Sphaerisporangium album]RCG20965.1 ATP-binding protein [Sphaerisporangium album]
MIGTPYGDRAVCWDIPADPTALREVRARLHQVLASWDLPGRGDLADDIVLATSEVLGNAVSHGRPPIRLTLRLSGETLCAEVTDHGAGLPERRGADDDAEHGRGLRIVEALCDEWGVQPALGGQAKTVWFRKKCLRQGA